MLNINYTKYSLTQHEKIYGSTIEFIKFISKIINLDNKNIIDLACGGGANTIFLARKFRKSLFLGIDKQKKLIKIAEKFTKISKLKNCFFKLNKWEKLKSNFINKIEYDGIISFQSLSFLEINLDQAIKYLKKKKFKFLAFSSLFWEGECNYKILVNDFSKSDFKRGYYNIYSIKTLKKKFFRLGYKKFFFKKYDIKYDLKKPDHFGMGSYTIKDEKKKRLIFSGSLYLPYGFILVK